MKRVQCSIAGLALALIAAGPATAGDCRVEDFDGFATGAVITTQIPGVTFQAFPQSCQPQRTIYPHIVKPLGGTSSGTKALGLQAGCPDFSPEELWMHFDPWQSMVQFTLGEQASPGLVFNVTAYNFNGDPVDTEVCQTGNGVYHLVQLGEPGWPEIIEWVQIAAESVGFFETIDDLEFGIDTSAPSARIDEPRPGDCLCDDFVTVRGIACDADSSFGQAKLEYRRVGTEAWTFAGTTSYPVCDPDELTTWDIRGLEHGHYYLRLTAMNGCGLIETNTVYVFIDRRFGEVEVEDPPHQGTVCGLVKIEGTVSDSCRQCFDYYRVEFAQSPQGPWFPVDPLQPTYDEVVIGGTIATWDTTQDVPDGVYSLRVIGYDDCANYDLVQLDVRVENEGGECGCPFDVDGSGVIDFADILRILANWGPCPS